MGASGKLAVAVLALALAACGAPEQPERHFSQAALDFALAYTGRTSQFAYKFVKP